MSSRILYPAVFVSGAATLIVEVVFLRVLAPYFGTTIYATSSVIGVVLGALAFGYMLGGRLADRRPESTIFWTLFALSGLAIIVSVVSARMFLPSLAPLGLRFGVLLASISFLLLPNIFLGALSPFAIRLLAGDTPRVQGIGRIAGEVFFISTLGSILGSLLAGFVLIPHEGGSPILLGTGAVLAAIGSSMLLRHSTLTALLLLMCTFLGLSAFEGTKQTPLPRGARMVAYKETSYSTLRVVDHDFNGRATRTLITDRQASGGEFLDTGEPAYPYLQEIVSITEALKIEPRDILVIGAGPYSVPQELLRRLPQAHLTVVDIDSELLEVGVRWFGVEPQRFTNIIEDGRSFLTRRPEKFDLIILDAFMFVDSPPPHMATQEFFAAVHDRLTPNGTVIMNVIARVPEAQELLGSFGKTFATAFPEMRVLPVGGLRAHHNQNFLLLSRPVDRSYVYDLASMTSAGFILTDEYAPIETLALPLLTRVEFEL